MVSVPLLVIAALPTAAEVFLEMTLPFRSRTTVCSFAITMPSASSILSSRVRVVPLVQFAMASPMVAYSVSPTFATEPSATTASSSEGASVTSEDSSFSSEGASVASVGTASSSASIITEDSTLPSGFSSAAKTFMGTMPITMTTASSRLKNLLIFCIFVFHSFLKLYILG